MSIFAKVALMLILSIVVVVVPLISMIIYTVDGVLKNEAEKTISSQSATVNNTLQGMRNSVESVLWQAAKRADLAEAVAAADVDALAIMLKDMDEHSSIDFITITDATGTVLLRAHSDRKGDSVANSITIKNSLAGDPITLGMDSGNEVPISVRGGIPLVHNGTLVGSLSLGVRLDTLAMAEGIKSLLGAEFTVFRGKLRIATSLKDAAGKPMVGTELDNPPVVRDVLEQGKTYQASNVIIGGISYDVLYHPLKDPNDKIIGMYFLGTPSTAQEALRASILNHAVLVGGGLALLMALIGIFAARLIITKPLAKVTGIIRDLVDDKAEMSYRLDSSGKDEVAALGHQVNRLTDKVEAMLGNIEGYKNLINAIPDPVFAVDDNYRVILVNERICKMAQVKTTDDLTGKHINEALLTNIYGSGTCPLKKVMQSRQRGLSEVFPLQIDGRERLFRGLADVLKDRHGNSVGFFQVVSDVTDTVEQERRLEAQMAHISDVNHKVIDIAGQVNQYSEVIQKQTGQIQTSADQQSTLMNETLRSIQQMNDTIVDIARSAGTAAGSANAGQERAAEGAKIVNEAMQAIDSVRSLAEALRGSLTLLGDQAQSISQVMSVISDVADQTNLLALNAAIEAARAGEAGRGFAVVADEVRKLAENTMHATQEVRKATEGIQSGTADNIRNMEQVAQALENATELSKKSGVVLDEIVNLVSDSSAQISSIATAAEQQSASSEEIARSVNEVTVIAHSTVHAASDSALTVDKLANLARSLHQTVS